MFAKKGSKAPKVQTAKQKAMSNFRRRGKGKSMAKPMFGKELANPTPLKGLAKGK